MRDNREPVEETREQRTARAILMLEDGHTYIAAAESTGIPKSTLVGIQARIEKRRTALQLDAPEDRRRAIQKADDSLVDTLAALTQSSAERLHTIVEAGGMDHSPRDLGVTMGIAHDKLARQRGWHQGTQGESEILDAVMHRLATFDGEITLKVKQGHDEHDPLETTIDVTPESEEE